MLRYFLFTSFTLSTLVCSSELAGLYEFWDYYSPSIFDNSLNSRSLLLTPSQISPILTDRGLYLPNNTSIKFPGDATSSFPSFEVDWMISLWYLPINTSTIMTLHIQNHLISTILEENQGKLVIALSYRGSLLRQQLESPFKSWRLFSIRLMQSSLGSRFSLHIDGVSKEFYSLDMYDINFSGSITAWEIGSGEIQGYLYQVWWHIDVDNVEFLSSELITACSGCESACILAPTEKCLGTTQDPYYNSAAQLCITNCISDGLSCNSSEECINACTFPCLESSACRSFETPNCPDPCPTNCVCYPSTDFCISCNFGYIPSDTIGRCNPSVPHCNAFDQTSGHCMSCETGYYLNTTDIPVCTICPEDCLTCIFSLDRVYCTLCPEPLYTQISGVSPYCAEDCPLYTVADDITVRRCLECPNWCPYCEYSSEDSKVKCNECELSYYLQPDFSCNSICPEGFYGDYTLPASCKPCVDGCKLCENDYECIGCDDYYYLESDTKLCERCIDNCKECSGSIGCNVCLYGTYLIPERTRCDSCANGCRHCYTQNNCFECNMEFGLVYMGGYKLCFLNCFSWYYIDQLSLSCAFCDETQCMMCDNEITPTVCTACPFTSRAPEVCTDITCPSNCIQCSLINSVPFCHTCKLTYYLQPITRECLQFCPDFYYHYPYGRACYSCADNCKTCTNIDSCMECGTDYYLQPGDRSCNLTCPERYYPNPTPPAKCSSCVDRCLNCTSLSNCFLCEARYYALTHITGLGSCVTKCPAGYYGDIDYVCKLCRDKCIGCRLNALKSYQCMRCDIGYMVLQNECVPLECDPNCISCILTSTDSMCYACRPGYFILPSGYECGTSCPSDSVADTINMRCFGCPQDCETCTMYNSTSTTCTRCYPGYVFLLDSGMYLCVEGTCPSFCLECYMLGDIYQCFRCEENYYIHPNQESCVTECPLKYYGEAALGKCVLCEDNCDNCNGSACMRCSVGYYLYQEDCYTSCIVGYYGDSNDRMCKECPENCAECGLEGYLKCYKCKNGRYLQPNFGCELDCPSEYYKVNENMICEACMSQCKVCEISSGNLICNECNLNNFLQPGLTVCDLNCPFNYYKDSSDSVLRCSDCTANCKVCTNFEGCSECTSEYALQPLGFPLLCDTSCPEMYYISTSPGYKVCEKCPDSCKTCTSSTSCTECYNDLYIQPTGGCLNTCPEGYFPNDSLIYKACTACLTDCKTCTSTTNCQACKSNRYYHTSDGIVFCVATCPDTFYGDIATQSCSSCQSQCRKCSDPITCIDCISDNYLQPSSYTQRCDSTCPAYYYKNDSGTYRACTQCKDECSSCNSTTCFLCDSGYFIQPDPAYCGLECGERYFKDVSGTPRCSACQSGCLVCNSTLDCSACVSGLFLQPSGSVFCMNSCPEYFYIDSSVVPNRCSSCASDCKTCTVASICIDCRPGYYIQPSGSDLCLTTCPYTYFPNSSITPHQCSLCESNCKICADSTSCSHCIDTFYLQPSPNPSCSLVCPDFYFQDSHSIPSCSPCLSDCKTCINSFECLACADPYYIQPGKDCDLTCPYFYFKDKVLPMICTACPANCKECNNESDCIECGDGYFMQPFGAEFCLETCPVEYYPHRITKTCRKCPYLCKDCYEEYDELACGECVENARKVGIDCACESGFIEDISENICRVAECRVNYSPKIYEDFGFVLMMSVGNACDLNMGIDTGILCAHVLRENYYTKFTKQDFSYSVETFISSSSSYSLSFSYITASYLEFQIFPSIDFSSIPTISKSSLEFFKSITSPSSILLSGFLTFPTSSFIYLSANSTSHANLYLKGMNIPISSDTPKVFTLYFTQDKLYHIEIAISALSSITFSMKWSLDGVVYNIFTDSMLSYNHKSIVNPVGIHSCNGVLDITQSLENGISYCNFLCKECSVKVSEPILDVNSDIENLTEECIVCVDYAALDNNLCGCNSGFYHSSSRMEACLPCDFPCETCQEIDSVFECLTCIPPYSLNNTACICDPIEYEFIDSLCTIKPLLAVFDSSINSISISFNKNITSTFEAEYISLTYPSYISYELISYNVSTHNYSQAADLVFSYPMKIDKNIEVYIEIEDVFIDKHNTTLSKLEYTVEMRLKNDTGIEEEASDSGNNGNIQTCPDLCTACYMINEVYICSICEDYAYLRDSLCYCFDRQNQENQFSCPKSCPRDMVQETALRTCIYPIISQEPTQEPEPEPEPTGPVYAPQEIAEAEEVSSTTTTVSNTSSGSTVGISIVTANLDKAWSLMNTIQIFSYMPLLQVDMPLLMQEALKSQSKSWIPEFIADILSVKTVPYKKAYDFKFKSPLFFKNSERQILILSLIISLHAIVFVLTRIASGKLLTVSISVHKKFYWSIYLRFYIQMYLDLCVSSCLQIIYVRLT